jgi:lipid II isoglutaminyl synthase (glutamine-hydrolysing)
MPYSLVTLLGKAVRSLARLRGGGSAFPGLFVEKIQPDFVAKTLEQLPKGVAIISGTNGKTTTTKMVVELLESQGLKVFTNRTGSNFSRGVAAALLGEIDIKGHLDADIAVLELDEAHGAKFVKTVPPRYSLILNVMRDQLDRFGEIDATAKLLGAIAAETTDSIVLNREDVLISRLQTDTKAKVSFFGLDPSLVHLFPNDDELHGDSPIKRPSKHPVKADVELSSFTDLSATFSIDGKPVTSRLQLNGVYNIFNAAAALAFTRAIVGPDLKQSAMIERLASITPAFGRGETITIGGQPLELVLVKNPSGFRLGLRSFSPDDYATMIAINDNYADGRDMSWLWDVEFESLKANGVAMVSGIRGYDMALRLQYDEVEFHNVNTNLSEALQTFISSAPSTPKRIYCTYTAMLALRKELARMTDVEVVS